ncbi:Rof/RNase P-like protein [Radiomyces spectabilis]|uniref:Rof/RNase P-like protein n=1 Tax=Radiomyces spectabilis TaxID=64574 RepID=UPI002220CAC0|nr:Rof/RNase P-like protein [Radiomyces spectabilis]KAI8370730.1 Rof/RNase P-like protein [Radiomyces spectabilis]
MNKAENPYATLSGVAKNASKSEAGVKGLLEEFIPSGSNASQVVEKMKVVHIDNTTLTEEQKQKKEKKKKKKVVRLTARERRNLGVYDIPSEVRSYTLFEPLHRLWQGYMKEVYDHGSAQFPQKLVKADFHGAIFTVIKSNNPSLVGTRGIVLQETLHLFRLITKENRLKNVPKAGNVFKMEIDASTDVYTLYGQQLLFRAAERAVKKFKPKPTIDL